MAAFRPKAATDIIILSRVGCVILSMMATGCSSKTGPVLSGGKQVNEWVRILSDPDPKLRQKAVEKLGNVGASDATVVAALCAALKDKNADVRRQAVFALVKCGSPAGNVVESLREVRRQDSDPKVRDYAARALETLDKR